MSPEELVETYRTSGLPKVIFCEQKNIPLHTLYKILRKYAPDLIDSSFKYRGKRKSNKFLPIATKESPQKIKTFEKQLPSPKWCADFIFELFNK